MVEVVSDAGLVLLEGTEPVYSVDYANALVDGVAPDAANAPVDQAYQGALSLSETDYSRPWTYGIDPANRGQALWFEAL